MTKLAPFPTATSSNTGELFLNLFELFSIPGSALGVVSKCTLNGSVKTTYVCEDNINLCGFYCIVDKGFDLHAEGMKKCRDLNARFPLPSNKNEIDALIKAFPMDSKTSTSSHFHLDLRNPTNSETKPHKIGGDYWVDAEGKAVGNKWVNLRVVKYVLS